MGETVTAIKRSDAERMLDLYGITDRESRDEALEAAELPPTSPQPLPIIRYDANRLRRWCEGEC